jgi:hypothetical protein
MGDFRYALRQLRKSPGVMPPGFQYPIQAEPNEIYVTTAIDCIPSAGHPLRTTIL